MDRLICAEFSKSEGGTFIIEGELIKREDGMEFLDISSATTYINCEGYEFLYSLPMIYIVGSMEKFRVILQEELSPLKFKLTRTN